MLFRAGSTAVAETAEDLAVGVRELLATRIERLLLGRRGVAGNNRRGAVGRRAEHRLIGLRQSVAEANGDDDGAGYAHGPAAAARLLGLVGAGFVLVVGRLKRATVLLVVADLAASMSSAVPARDRRSWPQASPSRPAAMGPCAAGCCWRGTAHQPEGRRRDRGRRDHAMAARRVPATGRSWGQRGAVCTAGQPVVASGDSRQRPGSDPGRRAALRLPLRRRLARLLRVGRRLRARVIVKFLRRWRVARAVEAAQPLAVDRRCGGSRCLRRRVLRLLRIMVSGRLRLLLLLAVTLLRVGGVLLRRWWRILGSRRLRTLCGAPTRAGIGLARRTGLTLPSAVRGTLGARHLENPSKRLFSR